MTKITLVLVALGLFAGVARCEPEFSPKLAALLERQQLANLLTYMDGKNGAEELLAKLLADPALLKSLSAGVKPAESTSAEDE